MQSKTGSNQQERLREIEDRKIEIIMELATIKDNNINNNTRAITLNSEYSQLHEEYYNLKLEVIKRKQKIM